MINEKVLGEWITSEHEVLKELKDLMVIAEKDRIQYAHESSERMKELNKMVSNNMQSAAEQTRTHNERLAEYIKLLDHALKELETTQNALSSTLSALEHSQKENDRLNTQIELLQRIIHENLQAKQAGGISINQNIPSSGM